MRRKTMINGSHTANECIRSHGRPMVAPTAHEYRLHLDESIRNVGATIGRPENAGEYRLHLDESTRNVGATTGRPENAGEYNRATASDSLVWATIGRPENASEYVNENIMPLFDDTNVKDVNKLKNAEREIDTVLKIFKNLTKRNVIGIESIPLFTFKRLN